MERQSPDSLPRIIQGGMGIGVSSWRLAARVAKLGEIGVVSGTAIDAVTVRELQDGDPAGRMAVLNRYPDQEIVDHLRDRYYQPDGRKENEPYRPKPIHRFRPTERSQRLLSAAAFSEVALARRDHEGAVGINLMAKLKRYSLPVMYGAALAGVEYVFMGAGIPLEEARQLLRLAEGRSGRLSLSPSFAPEAEERSWSYEFDPRVVAGEPPTFDPPDFYPIISSDVLARILDRKLPEEAVAGWVVEEPAAGGHNAPPRGKNYDENARPLYDERDVPDLEVMRSLERPFYLAGGWGSPEGLREALDRGAAGIQVGTLFSLTDESGYPPTLTRRIIRAAHSGDLSVRSDGRLSPTGFPFKVIELEDTLGEPGAPEERERVCDLGYLREPYVDEKDRMLSRCPAEPVDHYVRKGGDPEAARGRACLCNALMANIGLGQLRDDGPEQPLLTEGDQLEELPLGSEPDPHYDAQAVVEYLYGVR